MNRLFRFALLTVAVLSFAAGPICSQPKLDTVGRPSLSNRPPVPQFNRPVMDLAKALSNTEVSILEDTIKAYERRTTVQIAVLTVPTVSGYALDDYSIEVFDSNHFGQKALDNGVLIVIAMNDHLWRISTGYGVESMLPDSAIATIGSEHLVPELRKARTFDALLSTINALKAGIDRVELPSRTDVPEPRSVPDSNQPGNLRESNSR